MTETSSSIISGDSASIAETVSSEATKTSMWEIGGFLDALWLSLLCILMVFVVLIIITLIMDLLNRVRALDVKEIVTMKNGDKLDEDAMAAVLVASIDFRKETKDDFKVISCKEIKEEKKQ